MAYSEKEKAKIINSICDKIEDGESLRSVLKNNKPISRTQFYEWIDADSEKADQYARATECRAESIFEDILTIADSQESDIIKVDGNDVVNHDVINRARLRVDSRKWILSKMQPKKYGDKLDLNIGTEKPIEYINVSKQFPKK